MEINSIIQESNNEIRIPNKSSANDSKDNQRLSDEYKQADLEKNVKQLNKMLEDNKTHAEISVHDKFNTIMIKIIDDESGDVIMEVPPKKILDMVAKLCELSGVIVDKNA